jgi:small conductance mechanosensitive channel
MSEALTAVEQIRNTAIDLAMRFGPKLLVAVIIFAIGVTISRWAAVALMRGLERVDIEPPVRALLVRVARVAVVVMFAIVALQNLGVELLPLLAGLGVLGAGVALAMQGLLSDVAAGLSIIFSKPFRVGEYISLVGEEGQVKDISLFSTTLAHPDGSHVVIPNRKVVGEIYHNYGKIRQLDFTVAVAYDTDLELALAAIRSALRANTRVLTEPAPLVEPVRLADSSVQVAVKPWVATPDCAVAGGEIIKAIVRGFRTRGIVIPIPRHDVRLIGDALLRQAIDETRRMEQSA